MKILQPNLISASGSFSGAFQGTILETSVISGSNSATLLKVSSPSKPNILVISGSGNIGIGVSNPQASLHVMSSGAMIIPTGDNSQSPASPVLGMLRFNTDFGGLEVHNGTEWRGIFHGKKTLDIQYIIGAGGGGGGATSSAFGAGGGGAGGTISGSATIDLYGTITVTIGGGGAGSLNQSAKGITGTASTFTGGLAVSTTGGGGGGSSSTAAGASGGSGGGSFPNPPGGAGISGQGNAGGAGGAGRAVGGGGGGKLTGGISGGVTGNGGSGVANPNSAIWAGLSSNGLSGGGGGGSYEANAAGSGNNGGGTGGQGGIVNPTGGVANTSGGGGGGPSSSGISGASGGSGFASIKYRDVSQRISGGTVYYSNGWWYHTFTGSGTLNLSVTPL